MGRRFNTAGPCLPEYHYMIPPLRRLPEAPGLVEQMGYFSGAAPIAERTVFAQATTPSGRPVTLLRA